MNQRIEKVKNHFSEKKTVYYIGAGGFVVGATVGLFTFGNGVQIVDSLKVTLINWKSPHISQSILIRQGHPGYVIRCKETGELFASQNSAAISKNINPGNLSHHLNGKNDSVGGLTFERLGESAAV